jgi:glutamyl-tRNA synthetase
MKLSKRVHGPVVSVTTYRDAGFLSHAFVNFLCLLGWSPKNDREVMSRDELVELFTLEGINRANAVVNFTEEEPFDPKALWLNAEHIRGLSVDDLAAALMPFAPVDLEKMKHITPLIRERMKLLKDVQSVADFFFAQQLAPYDPAELIPKKGDPALAKKVLEKAKETLATAEFTHDGLEASLRAAAEQLGIKAGQMFEPIRVAVCGRKTAPPLFGTLEVLGRDVCLSRIAQAIEKL